MSTALLIRKLQSIANLKAEERAAVESIRGTIRSYKRGQNIAAIGDKPKECTIVVSGLLCRAHHSRAGKRQISSFHIPGDIPDAHSLFIETMDHNLTAAANSEVMAIPHEAFRKAIRQVPSLGDILWRDTLIEAAVFREWVLNVGRRDAMATVAHVLCEVMTRMRAVGLADGKSCALPITQQDLGDACGLSAVHTNRSVQALRAQKLIQMGYGELTVTDWQGLENVGEFDAGYLHLRRRAA